MSYALSSGVTGLQAHQEMLDVAGNNLANVNTTAYKASQISFSELLGQTLQQASQPTDRIGGTNPEQIGSGVVVSGITPDMNQGSILSTGSPLDMAIEGQGYFVVSDGERLLYTRAGTFGVDQNGNLVDPSTGYKVQRLGLTGQSDGFQIAGDSSVRVPYDVALPAKATSTIAISGNLSSDALDTAQAQVLSSSLSFTANSGIDVGDKTLIGECDQFTKGSGTSGKLGTGQTGTISISGYQPDGTAFTGSFTVDDASTMGGLIDYLNSDVLEGSTASLVNGQIQITDNVAGYSKSDITMSYDGDGKLEMPAYFELSTVGGDEVKSVNITVYDSQGGKHVLSGAFVRNNSEVNSWDMVLTSVTGDVTQITPDNRRVSNVSFNPQSGAYSGIPDGEAAQFVMTFAQDQQHPQTISLDFGTVGSFDGLTQFAGNSTAVAREQDGYGAGSLSAVSVSNEGVLIGAFSNGIKKDLAVLDIALFKNAAGLQSVGGGYYTPSANSGAAVSTQAMTAGAGTIHGGALEKSNADVASEFVNLIQAQNGFQANARTIKVANDILQELTNLIR